MKLIAFVTCILIGFSGLAETEKSKLAYRVVSDEFDKTIPAGKFVLQGFVYKEVNGKKQKLGFVVLGDENLKRFGSSGAKGYFACKRSVDHPIVSFSLSGYRTSYFEMHDVKEQHRINIEMCLYEEDDPHQIIEEKPVLYLYSDRELQASVRVHPAGKMLFHYPEFNDSGDWKVSLNPKNDLMEVQGANYPYLFWESSKELPIQWQQKDGELLGKLVSGRESTAFLEATLDQLGFNAQEKTDFITYWGPRLAAKNQVFIQFFIQDACDQFAKYEISPQPDAFNRVFMVFTAFDDLPTNFIAIEQKFEPMKRVGFHVLEWGGIEFQQGFPSN